MRGKITNKQTLLALSGLPVDVFVIVAEQTIILVSTW